MALYVVGKLSYVLERVRQLEKTFDCSGFASVTTVSKEVKVRTIIVASSMLKDTSNVG